ncbi:hypothetical protein LZG04_11545 [Saccharothrix sp. S26]|uniref:hypothetical protein n=1 Tax=Saccharothrix sp. S26 TaxID=2907215 RepID=UPI001F187F44|nr:hypothetical protein [Saccharothrix sp. S26]MCE6995436.1 hypothetical protein [Saccharothrix sp. S26]
MRASAAREIHVDHISAVHVARTGTPGVGPSFLITSTPGKGDSGDTAVVVRTPADPA